jgi:hypothetical protein
MRAISIGAGIVVVMLGADVSFLHALGVTALLALQTLWGASVYARVVSATSSWERLGAGFVVGTIGLVVAGQLRAVWDVDPKWWWSTIGVLGIVSVFRHRGALLSPGDAGVAEVLLVFAAALLLLAPQWYWPFPIGLALLAGAIVARTQRSRWVVGAVLAMVSVAVVATLVARPQTWRPLMFEQIYLEFVGQSALNFGGWRNPLAVGHGLNYHWLSYAWMTTYSNLLALPRLESLSAVGPVMIALGTVTCAAGLAHRLGGATALWWSLPALACFDTYRVWSWGGHVGQVQSQSQFLGTAMLLCATLVILRLLERPSVTLGGLAAVVAAATALTKSAHSAVLVGAVGLVAVDLQMRRPRDSRGLIAALSVLAGVATAFWAFLGGNQIHRLMPSWLGFAWEMRGDLRDWVGREPWYSLAGVALLIGSAGVAVTLALVAAAHHRKDARHMSTKLALAAVFVGVCGTAFLDSSGVDGIQMYFASAPSGLVLVISMSILGPEAAHLSRPLRWSAVSVGVAITLLMTQVPLPTSGAPTAIALRLVPALTVVPVVAGVWMIGLRERSAARGSLVAVALCASSAVFFVSNITDTARSQLEERRSEAGQFDQRFDRVGTWVQEHTAPDAILASNFFCSQDECAGEGWFDTYKARIIPHRIGPTESLEVGGVRFGAVELALATERRFLIQGYAWLWQFGPPPAWLERRVELSVGFANTPTPEELGRLRAEDVEWFVVDLRLTENRRWLPSTPVAYDDGEFLVLQLTPEQSP